MLVLVDNSSIHAPMYLADLLPNTFSAFFCLTVHPWTLSQDLRPHKCRDTQLRPMPHMQSMDTHLQAKCPLNVILCALPSGDNAQCSLIMSHNDSVRSTKSYLGWWDMSLRRENVSFGLMSENKNSTSLRLQNLFIWSNLSSVQFVVYFISVVIHAVTPLMSGQMSYLTMKQNCKE